MKTLLKILMLLVLTLTTLSAGRYHHTYHKYHKYYKHHRYNPMNINDLYKSMRYLSKKQRKVIRDIKRYAPKDLRVVLLAIAWQESSFGRYRVLRDKRDWRKSSYGIFHATLKTTKLNLRRAGYKKVSYRRIRQLLLYNTKFNIQQAVKNVRMWYRYRHKYVKNKRYAWAQALACYNGGFKGYKRYKPRRYSKLVLLKMRVIKDLLKKHKI